MKKLDQFRTHCCSNSFILSIGIIAVSLGTIGCSTSPEKRPSPLKTDSTLIGQNKLFVEYSSPSVRQREIFGEGDDFLVPFGKMWRTGANDASLFITSQDIKLDTFSLPKGKYSLFTIPGEDKWEIIFNKEWDQWGTYNYKDSLDALRIQVSPEFFDSSQEQMQIFFEEEFLKFRWDNIGWSIWVN